jgi:predicted anti-sigma-YlaC factor YlaD
MSTSCQTYEQLISARLDGAISPADESALTDHLRNCRACREFLESVTQYRQILQSLPEVEDEYPVLRNGSMFVKPQRFWRKRLSLPMPIAAGLALVTVAGWLLALHPADEKPSTLPLNSGLVRSVEIVRVQPVMAVPVEEGDSNMVNKKGVSL